MRTTAEWWRGLAVLTVAVWVLTPAPSGLAQTTSTNPAAGTTTTDVATTTTSTTTTSTSTTVPTDTTLDPSPTSPPTFPVVLPEDPFPNSPTTSAVGPTTGFGIPATVTTEVVLPFSTPFRRGTTTTLDIEPIAFSALTTTTATTAATTTIAPPTTAPPRPTTVVQALPAPVPSATSSPSRSWMVLAGIGAAALGAVVAWRRLRGAQPG